MGSFIPGKLEDLEALQELQDLGEAPARPGHREDGLV